MEIWRRLRNISLIILNFTVVIQTDGRCLNLRRSTAGFTFTETIREIWATSLNLCLEACLGNDLCEGIIFSNSLAKCRIQRKSSSGTRTNIDADAMFFETYEKRARQFNPASCSEIKKCSPSSTDGEYWLYPVKYDRQRPLRIYCHNMTSPATASEYLSLLHENFFIIHDQTYWKGQYAGCSRNSYPLMKTVFAKIRINIESLNITQNDFTFAKTTGVSRAKNVPYGTATDCTATQDWYFNNNAPCEPYGKFQIDLQGTGVALVKSVGWRVQGYESKALEINRSSDSTRVSCRFLGWCADCIPNSTIVVEPMEGSVINFATAKRITCED